MDQVPDTTAPDAAALTYGPDYYRSHCGPVPYERNDHWLRFFGTVADTLVRAFAPRRVFDAGCAIGLLVESFWDRGVEAWGRDISTWAVGQARADIRPYCAAGSIAEPIPEGFDLLCCIEVLEHMAEAEAEAAIRAMAAAAPVILFSSSPVDLAEPTHVNVRPPLYWLRRWAEAGFAPSVTHDAGYLAPHAFVLERSEAGRTERELVAFADRVRHRVAFSAVGEALGRARAESAQQLDELARLRGELERAERRHADSQSQIEALREHARDLEDDVERYRTTAAANQRAAGRRTADLAAASAALGAVQDELARVRAEVATLREGAAGIAHGEGRAAVAVQRAEAAEAARAIAEHRLQELLRERQVLLQSSLWRATAGLRRVAGVVPRPVRRGVRNGARLAWWTATLRLGREIEAARLRRVLVGSPLFDPAWYLAQNPDVAGSGLDPARHYALHGGAEGRDPGPRFSARLYLQHHPDASRERGGALLHALRHGTARAGEVVAPLQLLAPSPPVRPQPPSPPLPTPSPEPAPVLPPAPAAVGPAIPDARQQIEARFPDLAGLPVFAVPGDGTRRLTVVTDSVGAGSLYGGVGTALILAALLARRTGATLRLVTRTEPAGAAAGIGELLGLHGVDWAGSIETIHAPRPGLGAGLGAGHDVPFSPDDWFLTTSWWTTWATRRAVPASRVAHLLQEDERMFYPLGDDRLRCGEMLGEPGVLRVVNSNFLLAHLRGDGLAGEAVAFEPSFPSSLYHPGEAPRSRTGKRRFFFYARPHNARNLYWRGLEALCAAIETGTLDPAEWHFHFAGHGVDKLALPRGATPVIAGPMAWKDYAAFVRSIDLGLSLMYTPHPSYPPLDLAASGAVVVTNRFGAKQELGEYSRNILCADPDVPSLLAALREGAELAADPARRQANFADSRLQRDWQVSAAPALDRLAAWMEG